MKGLWCGQCLNDNREWHETFGWLHWTWRAKFLGVLRFEPKRRKYHFKIALLSSKLSESKHSANNFFYLFKNVKFSSGFAPSKTNFHSKTLNNPIALFKLISPYSIMKPGRKYFNFIHFLSAKFNFFDAKRYFSNCPTGGSKEKRTQEPATKRKREKIRILIMYINYVLTFF